MQAVVSRMTDATIARFVSRHVISDSAPTDRLALAFQSLVREPDQQRAAALAGERRCRGVAARQHRRLRVGVEPRRRKAADLLFRRDLRLRRLRPRAARGRGRRPSRSNRSTTIRRIASRRGWARSRRPRCARSTSTLVLDLLRIEPDEGRWGELMKPVVGLLEDLLLVGDFDAAIEVLAVLVGEAGNTATASTARRQHATTAIDLLIAGAMMRHITTHLATIEELQFERVKAMCVSLGEVLVRPLAEALSVEERPRTRERLTAILLAFGSVGRRTIERLKNSQNPAVRRTAIHLMRQFGGSDALPDLTELLDDAEPQVQREAVRAILNVGTDAAYRILEQALTSGTTRSRDAIMQSIGLVRDERATPLFAYILRHVDHRGALAPVYLRAIESLGALRDPGGIAPLRDALYKGEWWAPRRTSALRRAAAAALARIGTPDALRRARRGGGAGQPRHPRPPRARSCRSAASRASRRPPEPSRDRAALSARRRAAAALRRVARAPRSSIRRAIRSSAATSRRCRAPFSCSTACSRRSSSAWSATR